MQQNLRIQLDRKHTPAAWINKVLKRARSRSGGVVEQHLVGAKLEKRFPKVVIPNYPAHAGDQQTARLGDFPLHNVVYHVTATPSRDVITKCAENIRSGLLPVLLVPSDQTNRAKVLAQDENVADELLIVSVEDFVALNVIELAAENNKSLFQVLCEIIEVYNRRLKEVETNLSLQIDIR